MFSMIQFYFYDIFQFILGEFPDVFLVKSRCKKEHLHKYSKGWENRNTRLRLK